MSEPQRSPGRCPLCSSQGQPYLSDLRDYNFGSALGSTFEIRSCPVCEIAFTDPPMDQAQLQSFYTEKYTPHQPASGLWNYFSDRVSSRDLRNIERHSHRAPKTLFDLGAGSGEFLAFARRKGWEVTGLEPNANACETARRHFDLPISFARAEEFKFARRFDAIVARHSLEHFNDARSVLKQVFEHGLEPGGVILVKVPCADSWEARTFGRYWWGWDIPRHRIHFTENGIRKLLESVGFSKVVVRREILPNDWMLSFANLSSHEPARFGKFFSRALKASPVPVRLAIGQLVALGLAPRGAGRLIAVGMRPTSSRRHASST